MMDPGRSKLERLHAVVTVLLLIGAVVGVVRTNSAIDAARAAEWRATQAETRAMNLENKVNALTTKVNTITLRLGVLESK